jgi:putative FmdB family regulatory protein
VPIYEYRCKKCGKQFEYMQRMSDGPKKKCEACGALALERLISHTSFQLKGSGWYKDLYSSSKPASGSESGSDSGSGSGSDPGSGSGSESGTEAKPAAGKKEKAVEKSGGAGEKKSPKKKGSA